MWRMSDVLGTPNLTFPRNGGLVNLGVRPTMFVWAPVFAVNPGDPMHLLAADTWYEDGTDPRGHEAILRRGRAVDSLEFPDPMD